MGDLKPKLRILCFGDSLTAGFASFGSVFHPYAEKLEQMLAMAYPDAEIAITLDGKSGDMVSRGFLGRMERHFAEENSQPFDWTVVLGGTNDLAYSGNSVDDIFFALQETWSIPLRKNSKLLALTVPECHTKSPSLDARRNQLNELIKGHKQDRYHTLDLHALIPYHAISASLRKKYWDDGVHFTPLGYDLVGQKVGIALVALLAKQGGVFVRQRRIRKQFRDDELSFDEEQDGDGAIERGYIVVRSADL